jgi:electron transport complex protein RnfD
MDKFFTVSLSPHLYSEDSTGKIMYRVVVALLPALLWSLFIFGFDSLLVMAISVAACLGVEYLIQKFLMKQKPTVSDGSALVTGILLAFNVPSGLPWWIIIIGAIVAIGIGKMSFGGLGCNIFNPALVGRVFLLISFPVQMNTWATVSREGVDMVTSATPLALIKAGMARGIPVSEMIDNMPPVSDLLLGYSGGSLGEISALLLLIGGIYLLFRKVITWHIPVSVIAAVVLVSGLFWLSDPNEYINPVYHILTGGLMLGAIFMATDMVSSPMTPKGQIIYGAGIGVITIFIRLFGAYPEGVSFAILIMNAFTPLLNMYCKPKRFGGK